MDSVWTQNEKYTSQDRMLEWLSDVESQLTGQDGVRVRLELENANILRKEIFPILQHVEHHTNVVASVIRVLVRLTTPVECLDMREFTPEEKVDMINNLEESLRRVKESFLDDTGPTQIVVKFLRKAVLQTDGPITEYCHIKDGLSLIRNLVHLPDELDVMCNEKTLRNKLMWNLFTHGLDAVLMPLLTNYRKVFCAISVAEVVVHLYKHQDLAKLCPLLTEVSSSSSESESDISDGSRQSSSPLLSTSSDSTKSSPGDSGYVRESDSDSSDVTAMEVTQSESRVFGNEIAEEGKCHWHCGTDGSDSSNEESQGTGRSSRHSIPKKSRIKVSSNQCIQPMNVRRKQSSNRRFIGINNRTICTTQNLSNGVLKDFTVKFLNNGFHQLVVELKRSLLEGHHSERSRILWILTSILKLTCDLSLAVRHIFDLVSSDFIGYLVSEGVAMCSEMHKTDIASSCHRDMHLIVKIFREILTIVDGKINFIRKEDRNIFQDVKKELVTRPGLRALFLHLIRSYDLSCGHNKQFLIDIIVINHKMILLLDMFGIDVKPHLQQFATVHVMGCYGDILQDFKTNSDMINESILTMMHHVAGDLLSAHLLFQPKILKTFCAMMEDEGDLLEIAQWEELVHYILHKFFRSSLYEKRQRRDLTDQWQWSDDTSSVESLENESDLYWWYLQFENDSDPIGRIADNLDDRNWSRIKIIEQLYVQSVITKNQRQKFMDVENMFPKESINKNESLEVVELVQELSEIGINGGTTFMDAENLQDTNEKVFDNEINKFLWSLGHCSTSPRSCHAL